MKKLRKAIKEIKKFVRLTFQGCWLTAKISFFYNNPYILPLTFLAKTLFRRVVNKRTRRKNSREMIRRQRALLREERINKSLFRREKNN